MQTQALYEYLKQNSSVRTTLQRALQAAPGRHYAPDVIDIAALVALFPLVRYILIQIGLPWLSTLKRYSEAHRQRVDEWIDQQAISHDQDPDQIEAASRELMRELEQTNDVSAQKQWEKLKELLQKT
jgi:hypothetical protein